MKRVFFSLALAAGFILSAASTHAAFQGLSLTVSEDLAPVNGHSVNYKYTIAGGTGPTDYATSTTGATLYSGYDYTFKYDSKTNTITATGTANGTSGEIGVANGTNARFGTFNVQGNSTTGRTLAGSSVYDIATTSQNSAKGTVTTVSFDNHNNGSTTNTLTITSLNNNMTQPGFGTHYAVQVKSSLYPTTTGPLGTNQGSNIFNNVPTASNGYKPVNDFVSYTGSIGGTNTQTITYRFDPTTYKQQYAVTNGAPTSSDYVNYTKGTQPTTKGVDASGNLPYALGGTLKVTVDANNSAHPTAITTAYATPEPASLLALFSGLSVLGAAGWVKRRRHKAASTEAC